MISVGEELTMFGFVREECEKRFENHWVIHFTQRHTKKHWYKTRNTKWRLSHFKVNSDGDVVVGIRSYNLEHVTQISHAKTIAFFKTFVFHFRVVDGVTIVQALHATQAENIGKHKNMRIKKRRTACLLLFAAFYFAILQTNIFMVGLKSLPKEKEVESKTSIHTGLSPFTETIERKKSTSINRVSLKRKMNSRKFWICRILFVSFCRWK